MADVAYLQFDGYAAERFGQTLALAVESGIREALTQPPGRDRLASLAMQGLLAGSTAEEQAQPGFVARLARHAYQVADAMLAEAGSQGGNHG